MNERVTAAGNQIKQAFGKVRESWRNQESTKKKWFVFIGVGLIVLALGLVLVLNISAGRYKVLYAGMAQEESVQAIGVLESVGIPSRLNDKGEVEVPSNKVDTAIGQLAMQGIPSSTLDYSIIEQANGLTTTDYEKRMANQRQLQNRLQSIIGTYEGVDVAYVTLNMQDDSNRVWDSSNSQSTAGVKVTLLPGNVLTPGQVSGIRYLVGSSAGVDPDKVSVLDTSGTVLAAAGDTNDMSYAATQDFLQRQGFEADVERRLIDKAANILSLPYPDAADYRISATASLDWDAMITESMEYKPMEGTDHGVVNREELRTQMGTGQYAEGVVGETDNTDIPTYADLDGDGEMDAVDYYLNRDFLVSYVKSQVEKDGAKLADASLAVMIRGTLNQETRQTLRELISAATNLPIDGITVQGILEGSTTNPVDPGSTENTIFGLPVLFIYIAAAVLVLLILALIIMMLLRGRAKKKRLAAEQAEIQAEQAEAERVQQEIEERKRQLKSAAIGDQSENAITEEVRDFARTNPEITANLLRNWLKEGES